MIIAVKEESNKLGEEGWKLVNFHRDVLLLIFSWFLKEQKKIFRLI